MSRTLFCCEKGPRRIRPRHCELMLLASCAMTCAASKILADDSLTNQPPPFKKLRYDESYEYLSDPAHRSEYALHLLGRWANSKARIGVFGSGKVIGCFQKKNENHEEIPQRDTRPIYQR